MGVQLPERLRGNFRLRKVTLGVLGRHRAHDPLLRTVKAAINWSRRYNQALLAGEPDDDEASELSVLAEEQYLEWQREMLRPRNREDLAQGLGQPNGHQSDATAK